MSRISTSDVARLPPPEIDRETFLRDHCVLPPFPAIVDRVIRAIQTGDADATEIADLIATDPALVAEILKIVNSAYYGLPRQIAQVRHAVAYLGLAELERLVLTATLMRMFPAAGSERFESFWSHSFYSALVSRRLSRGYFKGLDADDLHTAVLLHDIGKLVYLTFYPEHYEALASSCEADGSLLCEAERELGYPSHSGLGALLCERWRLPDSVARACRKHELADLERAGEDADYADEVRFVSLSNLLANLAAESLRPELRETIQRVTLDTLGCGEQDFLLLMGEIYELKGEVQSFLQGR